VKTLRYLNSLGIPVYLVLGNQDYIKRQRPGSSLRKKEFISPGSQLPVIRKLKNLIYVHNKSRKLGKYSVVGFNCYYTKKSGFKPKKNLFKRKPLIFVTHEPPRGSRFGRIRNKHSPRDGESVGDSEITKIIRKYKPLLNVTGHMHEHWGWQKMGRTTVVASGFGYKGQAMLAELKGRKIKMKKISLR